MCTYTYLFLLCVIFCLLQRTTKKERKKRNNKDWNYTRLNFLHFFFVNWNCVLFLILHIPNIHSLTSRLKNLSSSIQNPRSSCMAQFVTNAFFLFAAFVYSVKQQYLLCAIFLRLFTVCILFLLSIFHLFFPPSIHFIHMYYKSPKMLCSTGCMLFGRLCYYIQHLSPPSIYLPPFEHNFCMI